MFIVILNYIQSIDIIETHLQEHRNFLDTHYTAGHFLASGPQSPRTGGVILVKNISREELDRILTEDPFYREKIAKYQVIEFHPNKFSAGLEDILVAV